MFMTNFTHDENIHLYVLRCVGRSFIQVMTVASTSSFISMPKIVFSRKKKVENTQRRDSWKANLSALISALRSCVGASVGLN